MKITAVLMMMGCLHLSAASFSQSITLKATRAPLATVLKDIQRQTSLRVIYNDSYLTNAKPVTIAAKNMPLEQFLSQVLEEQSLTFAVWENTIIIGRMDGTGNKDVTGVSLETTTQQRTVSGEVTDESGGPLEGATVSAKGTTATVTTDASGHYRIELPANANQLLFTMVGFEPVEQTLGNQTVINVAMTASLSDLDEVVVVGYGTQRKEAITSAITSVKQESFTKGVVRSPLQLLQGKVAGLVLSSPGGDPTGGAQINIRGVSTLASSSNPLIVVDGIPGGSLDAIAPEDIESIDVLKDGSAAAIYGSRANGGVIIVTTVKSRVGLATSIDYNGYGNIDQIQRKMDVFSAEEYRNLPETTGLSNLSIQDYNAATNWQNEILRAPLNQVHNVNVRGGRDKSNFIASLTYRTQNGIMLNSDKNSFIGRLSTNHTTLNDRLRLNFTISNNLTDSKGVWYNAYLSSVLRNPTLAIYNDQGQFTDFPNMVLNPVAQLTTETAYDKWNQLLTSGQLIFEPIDNLNIIVTGAIQRFDNQFDQSNDFRNQSTTINRLNGQVWKNGNQNLDRTMEITTDYAIRFDDSHQFTFLGGYSYQDFSHQQYNMYAFDFPTDRFGPWNIGAANSIVEGRSNMGSYRSVSRLAAFFGRINYDFNGKYLFVASLRREASSRFGDNHKWGWFPGVNVGWRISDEPFLNNVEFLNDLKLRVGYGITGTQPNDPYLSIPLLTYASRMYLNGEWIRGVVPSANPNPDLRWEKKSEVNLGIDFSVFNHRLSGSIDVYQRMTKDLLYTYNVPVPPNLTDKILANVGSIENSGVEIALNGTIKRSDNFNWTAGVTYAYNRNELSRFSNDKYQLDFLNVGFTGSPIQTYTHKVSEGQPIGNFYGFQSVGLDENGNWIVLGRDGEQILANDAGDGDKRIIGNGIPKMNAGFFTSMNYKSFDFSFTLRGSFGYQILNQYRMQYETFARVGGGNLPKTVLNKPYGSESYIRAAPTYVSYYVENGDFLKLDNVALGYTIPIKNKEIIKKARVYVAGLNLYTFTKYQGLDPEISIKGLDPGHDFMEKYPPIRTLTFGVNVSL